jgi:hypothetical protein
MEQRDHLVEEWPSGVHHVQPEVWDDAASLLVLALHHSDR